MAPATPAIYEPRDPSSRVLYKAVSDHLEIFLASLDADPGAKGLPAYVQKEFYDYLQCGILAQGFLRMGCDTCSCDFSGGRLAGSPRPGSQAALCQGRLGQARRDRD